MAQLDSRNPKERPPRNSGNGNGGSDPNFNWRGIMLFAMAIALIGLAFFVHSPLRNPEPTDYWKFEQMLAEGKIKPDHPIEILVDSDGRSTHWLKGSYVDSAGQDTPFRVEVLASAMPELMKKLEGAHLKVAIKSESNAIASAIFNLLPVALFVLVIYFFSFILYVIYFFLVLILDNTSSSASDQMLSHG